MKVPVMMQGLVHNDILIGERPETQISIHYRNNQHCDSESDRDLYSDIPQKLNSNRNVDRSYLPSCELLTSVFR